VWSDADVQAPPTELRLVRAAELAEACGRLGVQGCTRGGVVWVSADASPERARRIAVHELGHVIREANGGSVSGHLRCLDVPGDDVMCASGGPAAPTERDVAFVRGSAR
jgi:hypothetical protein